MIVSIVFRGEAKRSAGVWVKELLSTPYTLPTKLGTEARLLIAAFLPTLARICIRELIGRQSQSGVRRTLLVEYVCMYIHTCMHCGRT